MKNILIALLLLAGIAKAAPPQIGSLYTRDMSGSLNMTCTASVVSGADLNLEFDQAILTAAHCVDRSIEHDEVTGAYRSTADFLVTFDESDFYSVRLVRVGFQNRGYDVAVLRFTSREPSVEPLRVGHWSLVREGTRITNHANPGGLGLQRFEGYVSMLSLERPVGNSSLNWRGNAVAILPSAGGSSGSLVLSGDRVIGVHIGVINLRNGDGFKVFVPQWKFAAFLTSDTAARTISY